MDLAKAIKDRMKAKGWKQEHLAKASGITPAGISYIIRGMREITIPTLEKIAETLGTKPWRIMKEAESHD